METRHKPSEVVAENQINPFDFLFVFLPTSIFCTGYIFILQKPINVHIDDPWLFALNTCVTIGWFAVAITYFGQPSSKRGWFLLGLARLLFIFIWAILDIFIGDKLLVAASLIAIFTVCLVVDDLRLKNYKDVAIIGLVLIGTGAYAYTRPPVDKEQAFFDSLVITNGMRVTAKSFTANITARREAIETMLKRLDTELEERILQEANGVHHDDPDLPLSPEDHDRMQLFELASANSTLVPLNDLLGRIFYTSLLRTVQTRVHKAQLCLRVLGPLDIKSPEFANTLSSAGVVLVARCWEAFNGSADLHRHFFDGEDMGIPKLADESLSRLISLYNAHLRD